MNNTKTELIAVSGVKDAILQSEILEPYIDDNDKTPSWDGNIFVYKSSDINKRNLKGKIPIQIKGTKVNNFSEETISFSIDTADLNNYLHDGGILFFVVECINVRQTKIYYVSLLPIDIKEILTKVKEKQKSISATLRWLDTSTSCKVESICHNFLLNRELQYSTVNYSKNINDFEEVIFKVITDGDPVEKFILENDIYLYGKEKVDTIPIPISKIQVQTISRQIKREIIVDDKKFFDDYTVTQSKDGNYMSFGKNIKLYLDKGKLDYKIVGSLRERLKDLQFLDTLIRCRCFRIGEIKIGEFNVPDKDKEFLCRYFELVNDTIQLLNYFHIKVELEMNDFTEQDYAFLKVLIDIVLYNKKTKLNSINAGITHIKLGNIHITSFVSIDENSNVTLEDYFSSVYKKYKFILSSDDEQEEFECSPYTLLKASDLIKSSNLDLEIIEESIKSISLNERYSSSVNNFILEFIKAYDQDKSLLDFLNTALSLCEWLEKFDDSSVIYKINKFQIIKRLRDLERKEKEYLIEIKTTSNGDIHVQCAVSILLENRAEFEYYFERLSPEDREMFSRYPIFTLADKS